MVYAVTFVLAFCSIVYELLLGQSLSAFLGDTVLRYSVTIGLYMLSMGVGSVAAEGRITRDPVASLLRIELMLTGLGGFSIPLLHALNFGGPSPGLFSACAHALVVVIGVLSGLEIPVLIELRRRECADPEHTVIGVDYLGAFAGTVVFAFLFYPTLGLTATALCVAALNAAAGLAVALRWRVARPGSAPRLAALVALQASLLIGLIVCLYRVRSLDEFMIGRYLAAS